MEWLVEWLVECNGMVGMVGGMVGMVPASIHTPDRFSTDLGQILDRSLARSLDRFSTDS